METAFSYLRYPLMISSSLAAAATGLLYFKQNELIYPRNVPAGCRTDEGVPRPSRFGVSDYEDLRIPTPDGETLSAFFIRPSNKSQARNTVVLMFHGNAGNIGHRVPIAKFVEQSSGCSVFMLEYRGYGLSTGTPDEAGLMIDAQTALDYIRQQDETKGCKIVIYGQSIGGAVGVQLVAKNQDAGDVVGLILENTFSSMRKLIPSIVPPARFVAGLCHQSWKTEEFLPKITKVPILFMSGLKDDLVPADVFAGGERPSHMLELYNLCKTEDKTWRVLPNGTHNATVGEPFYFNYIVDFIDRIAERGK